MGLLKKRVTSLNRKWRHREVFTPFLALLGRGIVRYPRNLAPTESNTQGVAWTYWKNVWRHKTGNDVIVITIQPVDFELGMTGRGTSKESSYPIINILSDVSPTGMTSLPREWCHSAVLYSFGQGNCPTSTQEVTLHHDKHNLDLTKTGCDQLATGRSNRWNG